MSSAYVTFGAKTRPLGAVHARPESHSSPLRVPDGFHLVLYCADSRNANCFNNDAIIERQQKTLRCHRSKRRKSHSAPVNRMRGGLQQTSYTGLTSNGTVGVISERLAVNAAPSGGSKSRPHTAGIVRVPTSERQSYEADSRRLATADDVSEKLMSARTHVADESYLVTCKQQREVTTGQMSRQLVSFSGGDGDDQEDHSTLVDVFTSAKKRKDTDYYTIDMKTGQHVVMQVRQGEKVRVGINGVTRCLRRDDSARDTGFDCDVMSRENSRGHDTTPLCWSDQISRPGVGRVMEARPPNATRPQECLCETHPVIFHHEPTKKVVFARMPQSTKNVVKSCYQPRSRNSAARSGQITNVDVDRLDDMHTWNGLSYDDVLQQCLARCCDEGSRSQRHETCRPGSSKTADDVVLRDTVSWSSPASKELHHTQGKPIPFNTSVTTNAAATTTTTKTTSLSNRKTKPVVRVKTARSTPLGVNPSVTTPLRWASSRLMSMRPTVGSTVSLKPYPKRGGNEYIHFTKAKEIQQPRWRVVTRSGTPRKIPATPVVDDCSDRIVNQVTTELLLAEVKQEIVKESSTPRKEYRSAPIESAATVKVEQKYVLSIPTAADDVESDGESSNAGDGVKTTPCSDEFNKRLERAAAQLVKSVLYSSDLLNDTELTGVDEMRES